MQAPDLGYREQGSRFHLHAEHSLRLVVAGLGGGFPIGSVDCPEGASANATRACLIAARKAPLLAAAAVASFAGGRYWWETPSSPMAVWIQLPLGANN